MFISNLSTIRDIIENVDPLVGFMGMKPIHLIGDIGILTPELTCNVLDMQPYISEMDKIYDNLEFSRGIIETFIAIFTLMGSKVNPETFMSLCSKSLLPLQDPDITERNMSADNNLQYTMFILERLGAELPLNHIIIGWRGYEAIMINSPKIQNSLKEDVNNEYTEVFRNSNATLTYTAMV